MVIRHWFYSNEQISRAGAAETFQFFEQAMYKIFESAWIPQPPPHTTPIFADFFQFLLYFYLVDSSMILSIGQGLWIYSSVVFMVK